MMKNTRKILAIVLLAATVSGCASMGQPQQDIKPERSNADLADNNFPVTYDVKPGDRLSGIALKLTGEISNWPIIAKRNGITDPTELAAGDVLVIPGELLTDLSPGNGKTDNESDAEALQLANAAQTPPVTTGNSVNVTRAVLPEPENSWHVEIFTVKANRTFDLKPFDAYGVSGADSSYFDWIAPKINTLGTVSSNP